MPTLTESHRVANVFLVVVHYLLAFILKVTLAKDLFNRSRRRPSVVMASVIDSTRSCLVDRRILIGTFTQRSNLVARL